jgi:hypothetical protein
VTTNPSVPHPIFPNTLWIFIFPYCTVLTALSPSRYSGHEPEPFLITAPHPACYKHTRLNQLSGFTVTMFSCFCKMFLPTYDILLRSGTYKRTTYQSSNLLIRNIRHMVQPISCFAQLFFNQVHSPIYCFCPTHHYLLTKMAD